MKKWIIKDSLDIRYEGLSSLLSRLLHMRGISEDAASFFLDESGGDLNDPFSFNEMEKAVEKTISHIKAGNKIFIYGDYDADGVTSSAVLSETLRILKADIEVYIPYRMTEGYGLNEGALQEIADSGGKLVITVDTGIRNKEQVAIAKGLGLEVIITDHHAPPSDKEGYPDAITINALTEGEGYPFKYLAGVGVAFKLASAIIDKSKLTDKDKNLLKERVMDMVAIGTVADCVPLIGENRSLVKKGMRALNSTARTGLVELFKTASIGKEKELDTWNIGFQIAPRLNAAGRLDHANTAFELLVTKDRKEAEEIAKVLNESNSRRQEITEQMVSDIISQVGEIGTRKIIIAFSGYDEDNDWSEGVIGLAAGRVAERFRLPTLVITRSKECLKGSGRSIGEFNLIKAIEEAGEYLLKFGGHPAACGFALAEDKLDGFKGKMEKIAERELGGKDLAHKLYIDAVLKLDELDEALVSDVNRLAPFGNGNDKPIFASMDLAVVDKISMGEGGKHLKLRLIDSTMSVINAISFSRAEEFDWIRIGGRIDAAYNIDLNGYNGRTEVQMKIVDIRESVVGGR